MRIRTGGDPERIDRLFRASALMRPKSDRRGGGTTYGRMTIEKALAGQTDFYGSGLSPGTGAGPTRPVSTIVDSATSSSPEVLHTACAEPRSPLTLCSNPAPVTGEGRKAELYWLLAEYEAGRLDPVEIELGELPADATPDMRRVAEDMGLLMGLRLAVYDDRPLPYATMFAAERLGWGTNCGRASRAIRRLCDAGVIRRRVDARPPQAGRDKGVRPAASGRLG
jgi:hypothetical protein